MPAKMARSAPRPPFGLPELTVAVRTSLLSCRKPENHEYSSQFGSHPGNPGLDAIKQAGIESNTLFIFTSDNGPEGTDPWQGDSGPWRGTYFTAMEASLRAPLIIRWPGKVPAGRVSNEIVHIVDMFSTLARVGGAAIPKDRPIDGVDQLDFFLGKQENSNREGFPAYVADRLTAVKWRNWKMHLIKQDSMYDVPQKLPLPRIINLLTDRKEERDVAVYNTWVAEPMFKILANFQASFKKYPPIKVGTPDPYTPPTVPTGQQ